MLRSARITLKQHRFEIAFAALAAILVGAAALWVNSRLLAVNVPAGCFEVWFGGAGEGGPRCNGPVREFLNINEEEAGKVFAAMAVLPFVVGLVAGVPLVGRELEARTAQTAWALAGSRRRWFGRQLWPVVLVTGATIAFAAAAAAILESTRASFGSHVWQDLGLFGPLVVARALAALGVGLILGAALGRTLPAFIVGAVLSLVLVYNTQPLRDGWVTLQPRVVFDQSAIDPSGRFDGVMSEQAWRLPDGRVLTEPEAMALAPAGTEDPYQWLFEQGYEVVTLGITGETARGWEPLEIAGFVLVGAALVVGTVLIVDRRRPT